MVVIDIPIGFVNSEHASSVLRTAALALAEQPEHANEFLEPPDVVGVEQLTVDGAVIRTIAKTTADGQPGVQRELRRALTEALETAGISERIAASRLLPRPATPPFLAATEFDNTPGGAT
jgi:small conductance mechanosensitive channel